MTTTTPWDYAVATLSQLEKTYDGSSEWFPDGVPPAPQSVYLKSGFLRSPPPVWEFFEEAGFSHFYHRKLLEVPKVPGT